MKLQVRLAVMLIPIVTACQALPSFAEIYTKPFSTPQGDGTFSYDSTNHKVNYSIGNPDSSFSSSGVFQYDVNTWRGNNSGTFNDNGTTGTYYQNFPLSTGQNSKDSTFNYDPASNKMTWSTGDANSSNFNAGTFQYNSNTSEGSLNEVYKDNGFIGTSSMQFNSSSVQAAPQNNSTGNNFNYDPNTNKTTWSQGDPNSSSFSYGVFQLDQKTSTATINGAYKSNGVTGQYSQQFPMSNFQAEPELASPPGTVSRKFSTPKGNGVYTYDIVNHKLTYSLGAPNSSFFSSGGFDYNTNTSEGNVYVNYKDNGTTGGYTQHFHNSNVEAVPEPDSPLLKTLAFGAVLGAGLMLKRQNKKRKVANLDLSKL